MLPEKYNSFARLTNPFTKFMVLPREATPTIPIVFAGKGGPWYRDLSRRITPTSIGSFGIHLFEDVAVSVQGRVADREGLFFYAPDLFDDYSMDRFADLDWQRLRSEALGGQPAELGTLAFLICKPGHLVYGHWLVDLLPQIWLALRAGEHVYPEMRDLPFLIEARTPSWARVMIREGLAVPESRLIEYEETTSPPRYDRLLVPSMLRQESALSIHFATYAADIRQQLGITPQEIAGSALPRRFYAPRHAGRSRLPGTPDRGVDQEEAIIRLCEKHDVAVVDPGTLPWRQQVLLFSGAEFVVGPCGSGMHNMLFAGPGARSIVLGNRFMNWIQSSIAAVCRHRLAYLFEEEEFSDGQTIMSRYNCDILSRLLDQM